jgi:membrane fusion protein (multidrug efflux system)
VDELIEWFCSILLVLSFGPQELQDQWNFEGVSVGNLQEVEVTPAEVRDVPVYKEWVSTLDGMVNAQIRGQVTGYLLKQSFKEGDYVKAGQLLYEIDSRTFKASLDEAKANLAKQEAIEKTARIDVRRIERLLPENAVSVRDRDNAVGREASAAAEVLAMRASVEKAQLDFEFTRIKAPISGIVGISKAQIGDLVGPGGSNSALTVISQVDPIRAYISLSEQEYLFFSRQMLKDAGSAPKGVELLLSDGSKFEYSGAFIFADRHVDTQTGSILVAASFPNPQQLLRPGQFGRVRVFTETLHDAVLVPQRAVQEIQGHYQVATVGNDSKVGFHTVDVGERVGSLWVITHGVNPGDTVIVEGFQKVQEGIPVKTKPFVLPQDESNTP